MKTSERDDLLIRLSERSFNTWRLIEKMERHAAEQNGYIRENFTATSRNTIWRRVIVGVGGTSLLGLAGWVIRLTFGT